VGDISVGWWRIAGKAALGGGKLVAAHAGSIVREKGEGEALGAWQRQPLPCGRKKNDTRR
jgi:hypothetical protein